MIVFVFVQVFTCELFEDHKCIGSVIAAYVIDVLFAVAYCS